MALRLFLSSLSRARMHTHPPHFPLSQACRHLSTHARNRALVVRPLAAAACLATPPAALAVRSVVLCDQSKSASFALSPYAAPLSPPVALLPEEPPPYARTRGIVAWVRVAIRALGIALRLGPVLLAYPVAWISSAWRDRWWRLLLRAIQSCGPLFIKLGQWASTRRDLFSAEFCERLSVLHSGTRPHDVRHTLALLRDAGLGDAVVYIDPTPLGSGCIAQVHRAVLRIDGVDTEVAIKALHPRVRRKICVDLEIFTLVARVAEHIPYLKWLGPTDAARQFARVMWAQLDMRIEGRNLARFRENFDGDGTVDFPRPFPALSTDAVLVETYERGIPMSEFVRLGSTPTGRALASDGLQAFLKMMLLHNFVHGDLHPGNIVVRYEAAGKGGVEGRFPRAAAAQGSAMADPGWADGAGAMDAHAVPPDMRARLVFLDAGIVTELSDTDKRNFLDLFSAIAYGDGARAGALMIERMPGDRTLVIDPEGFKREIGALVSRVRRTTLTLGKMRVGDILGRVFELVSQHHVRMEGGFSSLGMGIMVIEGLGRTLDPSLDILSSSLPILARVDKTVVVTLAREGLNWFFSRLTGFDMMMTVPPDA